MSTERKMIGNNGISKHVFVFLFLHRLVSDAWYSTNNMDKCVSHKTTTELVETIFINITIGKRCYCCRLVVLPLLDNCFIELIEIIMSNYFYLRQNVKLSKD